MPIPTQKPTKGEETRAQILDAAVQQASEAGFESLTIGSRTELQIAVLDEAARRFTEAVFLPAFKSPRGLRRLRGCAPAPRRRAERRGPRPRRPRRPWRP